MNRGFVKLNRSDETFEFLRDPHAFTLLTVIAVRARRTEKFNIHNLRPGQALIGDHTNYGMTLQQYRTAKRRLIRWGFIACKATSKGTIATLLDNRVYDINCIDSPPSINKQPTSEPQAANKPPTTNKNEKNGKKGKKYLAGSVERRLSELLFELIVQRKPDFRPPEPDRWATQIDRMLTRDGRSAERIEAVIRWCQAGAMLMLA